MKTKYIPIKKVDAEKQIVFGEVYVPWIPDSDGDFMSPDTIEDMAHKFLKNGHQYNIDTNHDGEYIPSTSVVESFIARANDPIFTESSWVIGVHVGDSETWELVKSEELNGFSLEGFGLGTPKEVEVYIETLVKGETTITDDHSHVFELRFDEDDGSYLGGKTSIVNGHYHSITKSAATNKAKGHRHKFELIEVYQYEED